MNESSLQELPSHPDYKILRRVPNQIEPVPSQDTKHFIATIIDLETMGMDARNHEIIEIGLLSFSFSNGDGIIGILNSYNELHDHGKPIPAEITKITGITEEDVRGRAIDWDAVYNILNQSHLLVCHNSRFDRNFLELQTPELIGKIVEKKPLALGVFALKANF